MGLTTHILDINVTLSLYSNWNGAQTGLLSSQQFLLDDIVFQLQYTDANGNLDVTDGLSFYYDHNSASWTDFSTANYTASSGEDALGGILFVKRLTIVRKPSTLAILLLAGGIFLAIGRTISRAKSG